MHASSKSTKMTCTWNPMVTCTYAPARRRKSSNQRDTVAGLYTSCKRLYKQQAEAAKESRVSSNPTASLLFLVEMLS